MPGQNKDIGSDFAAALSAAQTPPKGPATDGIDLPDGFPLPMAKTHKMVDTAKDPLGVPGALAYDFHVQRKVFVTFRPWWECARCSEALLNHDVELPKVGDYECPHTNLLGYQQIIDLALDGKVVFGSEQEMTLKDGTILISLKWYESKLNHKKLRQIQREEARQFGGEPPSDEPKKQSEG